MLRSLIAIAAIGAFAATPAIAGGKDKKPVDPAHKIECRDMTDVGSHIPDRVCKTKAEWEQEANDAHRVIDNLGGRANDINRGGVAPPTGGGGGPG